MNYYVVVGCARPFLRISFSQRIDDEEHLYFQTMDQDDGFDETTPTLKPLGVEFDEEEIASRFFITEVYFPKIAAAFSILCSTVLILEIIKDIRRNRSGRRRGQVGGGISVISKVLLSVSVGDVIFSL